MDLKEFLFSTATKEVNQLGGRRLFCHVSAYKGRGRAEDLAEKPVLVNGEVIEEEQELFKILILDAHEPKLGRSSRASALSGAGVFGLDRSMFSIRRKRNEL